MSAVEWGTKRVRAYSIRVGDRLDWFDSKAVKPVVMVVTGVDSGSFPGVQQLKMRRLRGRSPYHWNMRSTALVRVKRKK